MEPHSPLALAAIISATLFCFVGAVRASPDVVVVFNEVQYNPDGTDESGEWIELFNQMGVISDVSSWRIDGIGYTIPDGTIIEPGGYLVIAKSPSAGQLGPFSGSIDNGGERLRLYNQSERLMDELDFGDGGRWPDAADGSGATLAKRRPYTANQPPQNWSASAHVGGTPGSENFPTGTPEPGGGGGGEPNPPVGQFLIDLSNDAGSATAWNVFSSDVTDAAVTDQGGIDNDVRLSITGILGNNNPSGAGATTVNGVTVPLEANNDYVWGDSPANLGSILFEFKNLDAGNYNVSVFAGRTSDANQEGTIWVGAVGDEPVKNTGNFANSSATLLGSVGAGDSLFYRHSPGTDWIGGTSGLIVQRQSSEPAVVTLNPAPDAGSVALDANLVATFDRAIVVGTGNITIKNLSDASQTAIPVGAPQVSISGAILTINPATDLEASKDYAIQIDGTAIEASSGTPFTGILDDETWFFTMTATSVASVPIRINELPLAAEDPFWVELVNAGDAGVELGGMVLTAGADPLRRHVLPPGELASGAFLVLTEAELGFRPAQGEKLFLFNATESAVLDARELTARLRGRSEQRGGAWQYPNVATPDGSNTFSFRDEVVISEIMYNPPALPAPPGSSVAVVNSDNQWIEIANRSAAPVALDGWEFSDGISFTFPSGTTLAVGEHACLARDAAAFAAAFPSARLLGEFGGSLSRKGERLLLRDGNKNPADEVRYFDSGRWPQAPDGGGSSLELRDLDADNAVGESWAASDESGQGIWQTYIYEGIAAASRGPDSKWSEVNLGLLDTGEILIDDITVLENGSTHKVGNGDFSNGATGWRLRGNHRHSEIIDDPDAPGNQVLRLVATGATGHMHNQVETTLLSSVVNGQTYRISFRARWVSGSNQLHKRLYFNRLPHVTMIDRAEHTGTPSAANSRAEPNLGPSITETIHAPAVPAAGEAVTVTARVADPDNVASVGLFYSVNGGAFQSTTMGAAAAGSYQGTIPGQSAAAVVQFYLEATDGLGATSWFPATGPESRALYKVDDGLASTTGQHNFRIVTTNADRDFMHTPIKVMSNDWMGGTVIDREEEIYYDMKVRLQASERGRPSDSFVGYNMRFGRDDLYRGIHRSMVVARKTAGSRQRELLIDIMIANTGGVLSRYHDYIRIIAPKESLSSSAVLQMARYDDVFLDSQFENGSEGNVYKYEFIYSPNTADANGYKLPLPDGVNGVSVSNLGDSKEFYRWFFLKKSNREEDDFAPIIAYNKKFSQSGAAFESGLEEVVDVDGWLRGMAYAVLSGAGDNAAAGSGHNAQYYAHPDGRVMFLPHDMDFGFITSRSIFANSECSKLTGDPGRLRIYLGHLQNMIATTFNPGYMATWTSHLAALDPGQSWCDDLTFVTDRSNNVLSQIDFQIAPVSFAITTPSPLVVGTSQAQVEGDGWVNIREIRLAGTTVPLDLTWLDSDSWEVTLPVDPGLHDYTLEAVDFSGTVVGTGTISIENTTLAEPASAQNLAISEVMYHPADPTAAEIAAGFDDDLFEFIELMNIGAASVYLTGCAFTTGINFSLPSITLAPGERVVLARDRAAFLSRHPGAGASLVAGEYYGIGDTNKLSNGGEEIVLSDALGADIRRFTYSDILSWPTAPDGDGPSLVLIAPEFNPDHGLAMNWRSSRHPDGNPGSSDTVTFVGNPNADLDGDGLCAFLEYALGTSDADPSDANENIFRHPLLGTNTAQYSLVKALTADDVVYSIQTSPDLVIWNNEDDSSATLVNALPGPSGRITETWQIDLPPGAERHFFRLSVSTRQ